MSPTVRRSARQDLRPLARGGLTCCILLLAACGSGADDLEVAPAGVTPAAAGGETSRIVQLLGEGQAVFNLFSGDHTREQGMVMAVDQPADFIFYSLESGPFDLDAMASYVQGMVEAAGEGVRDQIPVILRIPPIRDSADVARDRVERALARGVRGIVYPHVETPEQARLSVGFMGGVWPADPSSNLVNVALIEDRIGVDSAREIVSTPGLTVVIPGPGDLRRAYEGNMEEVEGAIQRVLAACKEFNVPCGITAGVDDVGTRLEQGFRFIIATDPETIRVGKAAAGREG